MSRLLLVCLGDALGAGLGYLVSGPAARWLGADFPYGTLLVNLGGSVSYESLRLVAEGGVAPGRGATRWPPRGRPSARAPRDGGRARPGEGARLIVVWTERSPA